MKFLVLLLVLSLTYYTSYSQYDINKNMFSTAIYTNIKSYSKQANEAYALKDFEKGEELFSEFVSDKLVDTYLDNFKAKNMNGALVSINTYFKKPVVLMTYASWCLIDKSEVTALNELAKKSHDKVDFVVLFWDSKNTARKQAKKFNNKVTVLYIDERENQFASEVKNLKHALGFPLAYYLDAENRIVTIKKNTSVLEKSKDNYVASYTYNYNEIVDGLNSLLINGELINEHLAGK